MKAPPFSPPPPKIDPVDWARLMGKGDPLLFEVEERLREKRQKRRKRAAVLGAGLSLALLIWAVPVVRDTSRVSTLPSHRQDLTLADGSHAQLNAHTRLSTDFRYGRRTVTLESGEAFFTIQKDAGHPFLVKTPHEEIEVLGTQFNVRLEEGRSEVTLLEGEVAITHSSLSPGQQWSSAGVHTLSPRQLKAVTAWRQGQLVLDGLTVAQAAERFSDYHGRAISIDPSIASYHLGGICSLDDLPAFFRSLENELPIEVASLSDGSTSIGPRKK